MTNTSVHSIEKTLVASVLYMRDLTQDKQCLKLWICIQNVFKKLHHAKQLCWIGRSEHLNRDRFLIDREVDEEYLEMKLVQRGSFFC